MMHGYVYTGWHFLNLYYYKVARVGNFTSSSTSSSFKKLSIVYSHLVHFNFLFMFL